MFCYGRVNKQVTIESMLNFRPLSLQDLEAMSMRSEDDMIDDLERVKQYRSNMMQVKAHSHIWHAGYFRSKS